MGWTEIMYLVMDVCSFWSFIHFVIITIVSPAVNDSFHLIPLHVVIVNDFCLSPYQIGASVLLNVCAVVITAQFSESMEKEKNCHSIHVPLKWLIFSKLRLVFMQMTKSAPMLL